MCVTRYRKSINTHTKLMQILLEYATHKIVNICLEFYHLNRFKKIQTYFNAWDPIFLSEARAKFFTDFRSRFLFPGVDYREWNQIGRIQDANVRCPRPEVGTATWIRRAIELQLAYVILHHVRGGRLLDWKKSS